MTHKQPKLGGELLVIAPVNVNMIISIGLLSQDEALPQVFHRYGTIRKLRTQELHGFQIK